MAELNNDFLDIYEESEAIREVQGYAEAELDDYEGEEWTN